MLTSRPITKLVFVDIETKANYETFIEMPEKLKNLFMEKYQYLIGETAFQLKSENPGTDIKEIYLKAYEGIYKEKAHLSPEFAGIICISAGMIMDDFTFRCASFCGENEKEILTGFLANKKSFIHQADYANNEKYIVCYNGLNFDIPFLSKRILYNGLEIPPTLDCGHLKPWEMGHIIDLKNSLKFGGMDAPSLESLCTVLGVTTAQDQFQADASGLAGLHKEKQYDTIKRYCEADVFALAQCYLKLVRSKEHPTGITNQLTKI